MEIPKFLTEMSEQMNNEDNRCTADPIWMVCHDNWLTCADDRGDKEIFLICDDGEHKECDSESEVLSYFHDHHCDWVTSIKADLFENDCLCDDYGSFEEYVESDDFELDLEYGDYDYPNGLSIEKLSMQKEMKVINAHLTEDGARQFIARKQHDYPKLYTYVYSMYYCEQMKELRGWIMSLTKESN